MMHPRAKRPPGLARAEVDDFAAAVLDGLSRPHKTLPCRFLYDARGSELFEAITRLPEYYPTRTEAAILASRWQSRPGHAGPSTNGDGSVNSPLSVRTGAVDGASA